MPYQISDLAQATDVTTSLASREIELGGLGLGAFRLSLSNLRKALLLGAVSLGFSATDPATVGALNLPTTTSTVGIVNQNGSRLLHTYADVASVGRQLFLGTNAGNFTNAPSGPGLAQDNTGIGFNALTALTTAYFNTAVGSLALTANTTGPANTAVGAFSMQANTTGLHNTAVGWNTLNLNTSGASNVALGTQALAHNTSGGSNVATGDSALAAVSTAIGNTASGHVSLSALLTGNFNTALGFGAGLGDGGTTNQQSTVDTGMVFIGFQASRDAAVAQATVLQKSVALGYNARVGASSTIAMGGTGADAVSVVIGATTATATLDVRGNASFTQNQNAATTITITNTDATNTASRAQLSIVGGGHNGLFSSIATDGIYIGATTSSVVRFISSGAEKFRLNTDGTVTFGSSIVVSAGPLLVGTTISTGAAAGNVVVPNGSTYAAVNAAGTAVLGLIDMDASNRTRLQLNNAALALNNPTTAASANTGGATALPANPVGYLILALNGTTNKIPYYAN